jgi:hypothetical protein
MQINLIYDQATSTLPAGFTDAMNRVVAYLDAEFTNNVTLDLHVGYGEEDGDPIDPGFQAENTPANYDRFSYTTLRQDLVNAATSTDDQTSVQNLPTVDPISGTHDWWVDDLQQRALGIGSGDAVGYLGFEVAGNTFTDSDGNTEVDEWDFDRSNGITPNYTTVSNGKTVYHNVWDFEGVALHEITEEMGRTLGDGEDILTESGKTTPDGIDDYTIEDLFRFSAPGDRLTFGRGGYASPDNGTTILRYFNPLSGDSDPGDWDGNYGDDSFNSPVISSGVINDVSPQDLRVMDILGWTLEGGGDDYGSDTQFAGEISSTPIGAAPFNYLVSGTINYITQGITPGDHDWFRVYLTKGYSYRIDVDLGTLEESHLALYDSSSNELAVDINRYDGGTLDHASRLFYTPTTSGYYYVDVSGYLERETGTYTVSVVPDDYDASINTTGTLAVGGSSTGEIETDLDSDWFKVQLTAGRSYVFHMSGTAETSIELHDANGNNQGVSANALGSSALIYRAVTGGTYFLDASTNGSSTIGGYTVAANLKVADDFNGDGTSDILFRNNGGSGDAGFYQINNGSLQAWHDIGASSTAYSAVGVGDFNTDGVSDVLFTSSASGDTGYYQINYSTGTLQGWHDVWAASTAYSVVGIGDFNFDGTSDILYRDNATGDTGFYQMLNSADSAFENPGWEDIGGTSTAYSVVGIGDFNDDGNSDILFRDNATGDTGFYTKTIANPWTWVDVGASSTAYSVVGVGDFNGDGTSDILYRDNTTGDTGFYAIVNGANTGWHDIGASSTAYSVVGVGDYNSDGTSDILFRDNATGDTGFYAIVNGANAGWHDIGASSTAYHVVS